MWWAILGCSLPEPTPEPIQEYERREDPFADSSVADTASRVEWSGRLQVDVAEPQGESGTCGGLVYLSVSPAEVVGHGNCLLTMGDAQSIGNELVLTLEGVWSGATPSGLVSAHSDDDSFVTSWTGTWIEDKGMRGEFLVVASDLLGATYDGEFLLAGGE
jgi:hypothetical protein